MFWQTIIILGFYTSGRDAGAHGIFPRKAANKQLRRIDIFNITLSSILIAKFNFIRLQNGSTVLDNARAVQV